jgi:hypothetical protein
VRHLLSVLYVEAAFPDVLCILKILCCFSPFYLITFSDSPHLLLV